MKFIDNFFLIKHKIFEKKNIILMLVLFFIFVAIMFCFVIFHFCLSFINDTLKYDVNYRTIIVENPKTSVSDIQSIAHVVFVDNIKFTEHIIANVASFNNENGTSQVILYPLLDDNEIHIYKGQLPKNSGEMVCSDAFYPYDPFENLSGASSIFAVKLQNANYIKSNVLIGKSFTFTKYPYIANNHTYFPFSETVVGTYKHKYNKNKLNSCYITIQDFDKYNDKAKYFYQNSNDQYGKRTDERLLIRVDSSKNVASVLEQLKHLGYKASAYQNMDVATKQIILSIPCGIVVIILFISFELIYHFLKKRIQYRTQKYGIMKATGFADKDIFNMEMIENVLVSTFCYIFSLFVFIAIYYFLIYQFGSIIIYENYFDLSLPIFYLLLGYLTTMLLLFLAERRLLHKKLGLGIYALLKEAE